MHQPMLPAAHQPGPKPPRPSRNPNPEAERPQNPKPPPGPTPEQCGRQAGNLRPPAQASPAAPHAAPENSTKSPIPHPGQGRSPSAEPPKNPPPGNPQMPQAHNATPRQQQKPQPDRIGTPTHTRWRSWSKGPREIDLMWQQKLCQDYIIPQIISILVDIRLFLFFQFMRTVFLAMHRAVKAMWIVLPSVVTPSRSPNKQTKGECVE